MKDCGILYSTTKAIRIGETVQAARRAHRDPGQAVIEAEGGLLRFSGKVRDVARRTTEGLPPEDTVLGRATPNPAQPAA